MSTFKLEIITPGEEFFEGEVESLVFLSGGGQLQILANHQNMISVVDEGEIAFNVNGEKKTAYLAEGFLEVKDNGAVLFTNYCDYDTDIETARNHMKETVDAERKIHIHNINLQKRNRIAITRTLEDLKRKHKKSRNI